MTTEATEVIEVEKKTTKGEVTEGLRSVEIIEIRGKDHRIGVMGMGWVGDQGEEGIVGHLCEGIL